MLTGDGAPGGGEGGGAQAKHAAERIMAQSRCALRVIKVLPDGAFCRRRTGARPTPFTMVLSCTLLPHAAILNRLGGRQIV
jgi:hypothetical protein